VFGVPNLGSPKTVAPRPLTASVIYSPSSPEVNQTVSFTSSASGGTSPYHPTWSFGDGSTGIGSSTIHNYTSTGTFTATIRVTDSGSAPQSATRQVTLTINPSQHTPPPSSPIIRISYTSTLNNTLKPTNIQPTNPSNTYLVINLTVKNIGYPSFTANPYRDMYVVIGTQTYNVSAVSTFPGIGDIGFPQSVNLSDGQSASGSVVFEVPMGSTSFTRSWRLLAGEQIQFNWVPIA
jgi:hypothetical protein